MKTAVELAWTVVILAAFCLSLYALDKLGVSHNAGAWILVGLVVLLYATWKTHWDHD